MIFLDCDLAGALDQVLEIEAPKHILLITGGASYDTSPARTYFDYLTRRTEVIRYNRLGSNPQYERVAQAIDDLKDTKIDFVIAIGGGSVIDYAKLLVLYLANPHTFVTEFENVKESIALSPLVAIPTTAGTGSEATHFAVMYKNGKKYSVTTDEILPRHVIIDPKLTYNMDPYLTAITGMDALCQAIESLWARDATPESRVYATKALELIVPNIEPAVLSPDVFSRRTMAIGAYYAGKAINISKTTGPHALSYYLTHQYGVPHGEAVAMTIETFIELNYPYLDENVLSIYHNIFNVETKNELVKRIKQIKHNIYLRRSLWSIGLRNEKNMNEFINSINIERMVNNPVDLDPQVIRKYLEDSPS